MIIEFTVENFGPIQEAQTLSFEANKSEHLSEYYIHRPNSKLKLLKLLYIFGPNASGKSSWLKALEFMRELQLEAANDKSDKIDYQPFLFCANPLEKDSALGIRFIHEGIEFDYYFRFNQEAILEESLHYYEPRRALVFERKTDLAKQLSEINWGSKIKLSKIEQESLKTHVLWNRTVLGAFHKANTDCRELRIALSWFKEVLYGMINPDLDLTGIVSTLLSKGILDKNLLVSFLKKADLKIEDVLFEEQKEDVPAYFNDFVAANPESELAQSVVDGKIVRKKLMIKHQVKDENLSSYYALPYSLESEGTKRYFGFSGLLAILASQAAIFSIDEVGSSLHPELLEHFLLSFLLNSQPNSQLILSTHQRELLRSKDILRADAIWFTEKQANGASELFSLADFEAKDFRSSEAYYHAYEKGRLGAIPNLDDPYNPLANAQKTD